MFFAICWSFNAGSGILHAPLCCSPFLSLVPGLQNETLLKLCFRNIGLCQFFPFFFFFSNYCNHDVVLTSGIGKLVGRRYQHQLC